MVSQLVGNSSIGKKDLVVEIGSGKGIITQELVKRASHVIAIELDTHWYEFLQKKIKVKNLTLYCSDFFSHSLPRLPYKVFANIPFSIEGKIIRKLLNNPNPPQDCYLIIVDKLANRLLAQKKENMFSAMHKPWFDFSIAHQFKPTDFSPQPKVTPVLFRFTMKKQPLLSFKERSVHQKFIKKAFGNGQSVRANLKKFFPILKLDKALQQLSIGKKAKPTQLNLAQWISLYKVLLKVVLRGEA